MNVYEEINDLYNFDEVETFSPILNKLTLIIDNESFNGYSFTTPQNTEVFTYRSKSNFHENGTRMGNPWNLYSITDNKHLILGRRTKKQIIEEVCETVNQ